jgi:hypothetical protein
MRHNIARTAELAAKSDRLLAGRLHENLSIAARSTGELQKNAPGSVTNILLAPAYLDLRSALLRALRPFPEASRAVAEAFRRVEAPLIEGRAVAG